MLVSRGIAMSLLASQMLFDGGYSRPIANYSTPKKRVADPLKKAARKRQKKARAINRGAQS